MDQVLKVFFRYQAAYYSAYVTIVHQFEIDFIFIEFLDDEMIEIFNVSYLSYAGEKGLRSLDAYQSTILQPILLRINYVIKNAQNNCDESNQEISNDEYIRQN